MDPSFDNFNLRIGRMDTNPSPALLTRLKKIILFRDYNNENNYLRVREKDKPFYQTLFTFIRPDLLKIIKGFGYHDYNIKEYWQQKYTKGGFHDLHCHSVEKPELSFIYFINASSNSSPIKFFLPGYPYIKVENQGALQHMVEVQARIGRLIVFNSFIPHSVDPNKDEEREIISGNMAYYLKPTVPARGLWHIGLTLEEEMALKKKTDAKT